MSAVLNGIEGGKQLRTFTIYNVSRDLVIHTNEHSFWYWLRYTNDN